MLNFSTIKTPYDKIGIQIPTACEQQIDHIL